MELQASTKELRNGSTQATPVDVCVSFPAGTRNVGDPVKVEVKSTWSWLRYLVGRTHLTSKTLKGSATMRLEAKPTNYVGGVRVTCAACATSSVPRATSAAACCSSSPCACPCSSASPDS